MEENVGVFAKEECSIPAGMGKYIPVQTNHEITGDVLIKISNKTMAGLILPEIVYNVKKKLESQFLSARTLSLFQQSEPQQIGPARYSSWIKAWPLEIGVLRPTYLMPYL